MTECTECGGPATWEGFSAYRLYDSDTVHPRWACYPMSFVLACSNHLVDLLHAQDVGQFPPEGFLLRKVTDR
jgi:hypothetical protein